MTDWTTHPNEPLPCNYVVSRDEQKRPVYCGKLPVYFDGKCVEHTKEQSRGDIPSDRS